LISKCRVCANPELHPIIDLGNQRLSDFRSDNKIPEEFPLNLLLCNQCSLVQLSCTAPREKMYHDGYGYKSGVNEALRENLSRVVQKALEFIPNPKNWLDIACNDGTLLSYVPKQCYRVGIDPVAKFSDEALQNSDTIITDYFPPKKRFAKNEFDVITSSFMFYDVDNPNSFVEEVKQILAEKGIWIIQQNYLLSMIKANTFDNISHEHLAYYSLTSMKYILEKYDLEIIDAYEEPINGGSFILVVGHKSAFGVKRSVELFTQSEVHFNVYELSSYTEFYRNVEKIVTNLKELIRELKEKQKIIDIYGASTRGSTIWQLVGLDSSLIRQAVERQDGKIGKIFSAIQIPIVSESDMRLNPPDYLLVGPWFLKNLFIEREYEYLKNGGKMIFPLPEVEIHSLKN